MDEETAHPRRDNRSVGGVENARIRRRHAKSCESRISSITVAQVSKDGCSRIHCSEILAGPSARTHKMPDRKAIWRVVVPVVLIAAVIALTLGVACHSHVNCTPSTCPLCHLAIAYSVGTIRAYVLMPIGQRLEPQTKSMVARLAPRQIPARAPPA